MFWSLFKSGRRLLVAGLRASPSCCGCTPVARGPCCRGFPVCRFVLMASLSGQVLRTPWLCRAEKLFV